RIVHLQDAAPPRRDSGLRSMEDRGCVQPNIASFSQARNRAATLDNLAYVAFGNPSKSVRARSDQKWRIVCGYWINMNAQGRHVRQDFSGRFDMQHSALDAPGIEAIDGDPLLNGNGAVLVPTQGPVRRGALVEQNGSGGSTIISQH